MSAQSDPKNIVFIYRQNECNVTFADLRQKGEAVLVQASVEIQAAIDGINAGRISVDSGITPEERLENLEKGLNAILTVLTGSATSDLL